MSVELNCVASCGASKEILLSRINPQTNACYSVRILCYFAFITLLIISIHSVVMDNGHSLSTFVYLVRKEESTSEYMATQLQLLLQQ